MTLKADTVTKDFVKDVNVFADFLITIFMEDGR